ncbi:hypothetical protein B6V75_00680 [Thioclava sp. F1Mire-8]|uniref:hypothetical protein n=1 Tax=Thioclava sp. F1Mire-8 TaxID=1973006 RepID=UPI000B545560|nr:hypothetical protein [Thioclava sp. F1Mire-8]OWY04702.1 hypothetical protein B6V75_00680 [Thioclava sp. F1Mire-8]
MSDPLAEFHENGRAAGVRIIEDLVRNGDMDECVNQIRTAAINDSKFNWHLLESIAALAAYGLENSEDQDETSK